MPRKPKASKQLATKGYVRNLLRTQSELKFWPTYNNTAISTTPNIVDLFDPALGTADNDRIGDKVQIKSIDFRSQITLNASATEDYVRLMIVQWRDDSTAGDPTSAYLLQNNSTTYHAITQPDLERHEGGQFRLLFDKTYPMNSVSRRTVVARYRKTWKVGHQCQFMSETTEGKGKVFLMTLGVNAVNTSSHALSCQVRYTDQ